MVRKISNLLAGTALCSVLFAGAAGAKEIQTNMARMQAMDKVTGKVSEIDVPVNGETVFGSFSIVVRYCATRSPEETPENFAFVDVVDNYKTNNPVNVFKGWMMSSSPALNAVEHPIYDVWLLKCYDGDTGKMKLLSAEELKARDETIKAQPKTDQLSAEARKALEDEQRAAEEAEKAKQAQQAEPLKAGDEAEAAQEESAAAEKQTASEPVALAPVEGAPQPLFVPAVSEENGLAPAEPATETEPVSAGLPVAEAPAGNAAAVEVNLPAEAMETGVPEETVNSVKKEFGATSQSVVNAPSENPDEKTIEPAAGQMTEDGLLLPEATAQSADIEEQPAQLIKFEDEIEEDSFDIDAEALAN